jgi:GNAT superfamily N-acetyltransferase
MVAETESKDLDSSDTKLSERATLALRDKSYHFITNEVVGVSHAYICPNKKQLWVEGIRVNPRYRRMGIASMLICSMIEYGKNKHTSITETAAITAETNIASRSMLEKNDFQKGTLWTYYTRSKEKSWTTDIRGLRISNNNHKKDDAREGECMDVAYASPSDIEEIITFLSTSKTFISGGRRYVQSWKWYELDLQSSKISELIANKDIIFARTKGLHNISGLAITDHICHNGDDLSLQLVYLDARAAALKSLLAFIVDYVMSSYKIDTIQLFIPKQIHSDNSDFCEVNVLAKFGISAVERFLLYTRRI